MSSHFRRSEGPSLTNLKSLEDIQTEGNSRSN